jgi:NADH-quinone oxidoreductase subunit C
MQAKEIYEILKTEFGDSILSFNDAAAGDPFIEIQSDKILEIGLFARDNENLLFDYLASITGMDLVDKLCVVYHLYSVSLNHRIAIKLYVPKDNTKVPTVEKCWRTADWHEREAWDLIGIEFTGHHNLIRILCPYDWEGHALRKDYVAPEYYHGIKVN